VAAASLIEGKIADPREYGDPPDMLDPSELKPYLDDVHIFKPAPEDETERIEIPRGPNIKTRPSTSRCPSRSRRRSRPCSRTTSRRAISLPTASR
jgi:hypothetical protein